MIDIILSNFGFWINLAIPIIFATIMWRTKPEYVLKELGMQVAATFGFLALTYWALFAATTDLYDTEHHNGFVKQFTYYEKWTELVHYTETYSCGTSKNPRTCSRPKTRLDHHSPYWEITTSNGEVVYLKKNKFKLAADKYGKQHVNIFRSGQVSFGDGDKYVVSPSDIIPTAVGHTYINYVIAAKDNVINERVSPEEIEYYKKRDSIRPRPSSYRGQQGEPRITRIVNASGLSIPKSWTTALDHWSAIYGSRKQVNPIIYLTSEDRDFERILRYHWKGAAKNDIVLILGIKDLNVSWSSGFGYPDNTDLLVDMSNKFKGMSLIDTSIPQKYSNLLQKGYKRMSMEEFKYLTENLTLEWYWQLLVILLNIGLSFLLTRYFLNNYDGSTSSRHWRSMHKRKY